MAEMDESRNDWIFHFRLPDEASRVRVYAIIRQMRISEEGGEALNDRKADIGGNFDIVLGHIWNVILNDWETNSKDGELPGFDYVIMNDGDDCLGILTRLFVPGKKGNLYYGRYICRRTSDRYEAWIDD